ncbi:MAG: hypothetical protein WDZ76_06850 [Pseudohongiellaceae bacterium]
MRRHSFVTTALAAATLLLTNCSVMQLPAIQHGDPVTEPGRQLAVGERGYFRVFTSESAADSGIHLSSGASYQLMINPWSIWVDGNLLYNENGEAIDERGFNNEAMTWIGGLFSPLRKAPSNRWFELMLRQPACNSEQGVTALERDQQGRYRYTPSCDGNLVAFVNDVPGFYGNNGGFASITVQRLR